MEDSSPGRGVERVDAAAATAVTETVPDTSTAPADAAQANEKDQAATTEVDL